MVEALFEAVGLLKEAVVGLTQSACLTCGAEPGCNIDCKGCVWVIRARQFLLDSRIRGSAHDASCESELTSHGYTPCLCDERKAEDESLRWAADGESREKLR